jgi:hypothetical protein
MTIELDAFGLAIRQILLTDWDPSNAARIDAARGEYDSYIGPIAELIQSGAGEGAIIDYLYGVEREILCFPALGKQRLRRVAHKLMALRSIRK